MKSERWDEIQALFHKTAELPESEWLSHLESAGINEELKQQVLDLLREDSEGTLLDHGIAQMASSVLESTPDHRKQFGPYHIIRVLGEGGMGTVYLAGREDLKNKVALKVLRDAWLSPARRERFLSEQRLLAQLSHSSIARLYDADTLPDGTPWFVMEYVDGAPLTEYCRARECSVDQKLRLIRAVCEAVQYAHAHAVIHRDLKPSNILVKEGGAITLLDFGIAKQLESLDSNANQTMTGLRLLTPAYAAPEQIRGQQIGVHTDVYALGVVLFELLTGELPFDLSNLNPAEAATIVESFDPGKPSARHRKRMGNGNGEQINRVAWSDLDVLCMTAMHKDPQRRYRSVEALVRDIDHYLDGEPLEARPDSILYRADKYVRRNWRMLAVASVVFAFIVGLTAVFTWRLTKARNVAEAETARTQRIQRFMIDVFQGGDAIAGPAADVKVVDMLDRGTREAQALDSDPRVRADLLFNFAEIYEKQGQIDKAEALFLSSLEQRKRLYGSDSAEVAEALTALGMLRAGQSRLEEAETLTRDGLAMSRRHLATNSPMLATAVIAVGRVLGQRGAFDEAIQILDGEVSSQALSGASDVEMANSLSALADVQYNAGHYQICVPLYRRLLDLHRKVYGSRHPLIAEDLSSLAAAMIDLGYYVDAVNLAKQAIDVNRSYYGAQNPKVAANLTTLGRALTYEKNYDEATSVLEQALAMLERAYGKNHSEVAETLNELGNVDSMRNRLDEAEAKFLRVVDIYRSIYGDHHSFVAVALSNVGSVRMDKKDYRGAERIYRNVVQRFTDSLSADNLNTGIAEIKLGRTLLRERRFTEAEAETLKGYKVLEKQTSPSTSFLHAARKDLAAEYEGMNQPETAARFRAELALMDRAALSSAH